MAVIKHAAIQTSSGFDTRDIGAEAQNIEVSRDSSGEIIEDITASGVTVDSTEGLSTTLKDLEDNKQAKLTFDTSPTSGSTNPVTSDGVYTAVQADNSLSTTSEKAVQNKVITSNLNQKVSKYNNDTTQWDTTPTSGSTKPVTSGGVYEAIAVVAEEDRNIHNIPRVVSKDITEYVTDGTLWKRLNGTDGFELYEDLFVGDYIQMSRPISAYNQDQTYQITGSEYVTIAGIDTLWGNGDNNADVPNITYHHLVMIPGQGLGGTEHFGRSRMNSTNVTTGGYVGSEMFTTTIGPVTSTGSTATTATINEQLYAEFGSHLKTIRELLTNAIIASGASATTGYNRFGTNSGCAAGWAWTSVQACLMSEIEVYGSIVWDSTGYNTGTGKAQLPLFEHSEIDVNDRTAWYWLRGVASGAHFCGVGTVGAAAYAYASDADSYVRPRFVLGA